MIKKYSRINILVPKKQETRKALKNIYKTLREIFTGYTEEDVLIVIRPARGIWKDTENGKIISDRHTSINVDFDSSKGTTIIKHFADIKKTWEKQFNEQEIYATIQSILRIV